MKSTEIHGVASFHFICIVEKVDMSERRKVTFRAFQQVRCIKTKENQERNSTLFLIFSLWAVRKLIWSVSGKFSQVHKGDKIGFEKPILKFRVPKGHEKFQRLREANFVSRVNLRNFSRTLHISLSTSPKRKY